MVAGRIVEIDCKSIDVNACLTLSLQMLEHHLGNSFMEKEEIDKKTVIRTNWKKLIKQVRARFSLEYIHSPLRASVPVTSSRDLLLIIWLI